MALMDIELAAAQLKSEFLGEDTIETIFGELFESGELDESILESEEVVSYKQLLEMFLNDVYDYINTNLYKFIGENAEETYRKLSVFVGESVKSFLTELSEFDYIIENIDEDEEDIVQSMLREATYIALASGQGAVDLLNEISQLTKQRLKKAGKIAAGVGAAAGLAGGAYAAYKNRDEIESTVKNAVDSVKSKILGNQVNPNIIKHLNMRS